MGTENVTVGLGQIVPDCILLYIFGHIKNPADLCRASFVCKSWHRVAYDEFLWKDLFCNEWKLSRTIELAPGKYSWRSEFIRLYYRTPVHETEKLTSHTDQVLHVCFSHDGQLFSSCSKDSHVKVWNVEYPMTIRYDYNMTSYSWEYTQFSQYNETDTLLLVSGVLVRSHTFGEIAVFSLKDEFTLQCRIQNRPYDIFGAWYSDSYLISGSIKWLTNAVSSSILWLNSAFQEIECENKSVLKEFYRFYNKNASSIRTIMVANCVDSVDYQSPSSKINCLNGGIGDFECINVSTGQELDDDDDEILLDDKEKYLIFTTGSKAFTPHEIGFKKIKPVKFKRKIDIDLKEKLAERNRQQENANRRSPNWLDEDSVNNLFDKIDCRIDLYGHIIGMALSPDHRYLYVNSRPWPSGATVENPYDPPPIAQEIDIHVIDMMTLTEVGTMLRSHKAFTPNDECFFIFLDVSNNYVASGAEDKYGYLWDRHYSALISKLSHSDVVNSVAFNPQDEEMLVSVSDDFTIKVWRSKSSLNTLKSSTSTSDVEIDENEV